MRSSYNGGSGYNAVRDSRDMQQFNPQQQQQQQPDVRSSWDRNSGPSTINKDFCEVLDRGSLDDVARLMESTGPRPEVSPAFVPLY